MAMEMDFDPYKSEIDPQYYDGLREVANFMRANPAVTATVEGHAASKVGEGPCFPGAGYGNLQSSCAESGGLSWWEKKASPVRVFLLKPTVRTRRVAYGTSLEGQQENRRVNIIFNYPKK